MKATPTILILALLLQTELASSLAGSFDKLHGELAADYSARHGGRAVLVMVDGEIVFERYDNGFGPDTATHLHSATKGFWGPVIAAMIEDGLIESFDELASKTLPEWKDHPCKSRITLRHLLTLSAGLVQDVVNLQGHDRATLAPDLYKHAIQVWAVREPGAVFQYGPSCYYVLGEIMKRKLASRKQTPLDYLKHRILDPIGVQVGDWVHDASGNPHVPNGAHLTARNWAKFGQWLFKAGEWNGRQIVKRDLLGELVQPSEANPGHGLALWLNQPGGRGAVAFAGQKSEPDDEAGWIYRGGHRDLFAALGAGKCRMYVIPSLKMVALRQGDSKGDRFDDNTFLTLLLTEATEAADEAGNYQPGSGNLTAATENTTWTDASRDREVPICIFAPDLKHGAGPFPTIVFSHGGGESREAFGYFGDALARDGYIVVFLTHKGSDREALRQRGLAALGASAFKDRPTDVRFAIDRLLSANLEDKLLAGRIDPNRLAVAGQCAGATTALAVAGLTTKSSEGKLLSYRDPTPKAVVALSPQPGASSRRTHRESLHDESWKTVSIPALVITGSKDFRWIPVVRRNPDLVRRPYTGMAAADKYLVDISDAEHHAFTDSQPYYPGGPRDPRHHGWIVQATIAFLDAYLSDDDAALRWLQAKKLETATRGQCRQEHELHAEVLTESKATDPKNRDLTSINAFLEKSLPRVGGGCALILIEGDQVIYRTAFGSFTTETVVPIASASKWISGGVIMALVDDGLISLDDTASKYLPAFTDKKGEITVRQMFSHTHGLPERPPHHRNTRLTLKEAVDKIASVPLAYDPGSELVYSGLGMQVAARIAELAAGKSWGDIFRDKIARPLKMDSTTYYAFGRTDNPNVAGSVETCIDDYGNFVTMLLNGGIFRGRRVLSEQAVATMLTNQSGDVPIRRHPWQAYTDFDPHMAKTPYGIGCWLEEVHPETGKAWRASSGGAFGCQPFVDLKRNVAGVFLPYARTMKRSSSGLPYNDASVVYLELREIINAILDGKPLPEVATATATERQTTKQNNDSEIRRQLDRIFQFADGDRDGKLTREEIP